MKIYYKLGLFSIILIFLVFISFLNLILFYKQFYLGNIFILFYFLISIILIYISIYYLKLNYIKNKIVMTFLFFKVPLTLFLIYLYFSRYNGGDLNSYYFQVMNNIFNNDFQIHFSGVQAVQAINFIFFHIFPNSLIGMSFIYAAISFIAYLILFNIFYKYSFNPKLLFILLFFIPTISMQSSFFGKDGYVLIFLSFIFFSIYQIYINNKKWYWILFLISFIMISSIRSYQGAIILVSLYLFFISKTKLRFIIGSLLGIIFMYLTLQVVIKFFLHFVDFSNFNLAHALAKVYSGGSLMLEPFAFPFNFLQIFRPFPWEANNIFLFIDSIENLVVFYIIFLLLKKYYNNLKFRVRYNPLYRFLFFYILITWFLFSFDPNMGDLIRRKIYLIPYLFVLLI